MSLVLAWTVAFPAAAQDRLVTLDTRPGVRHGYIGMEAEAVRLIADWIRNPTRN